MAKARSFGKRLLRWLGLLLAGWLVFSIGSVLLMRWVDPWTSTLMLRDRSIALFSGDKSYHFSHQWVDWPQISNQVKVAVIAAEDQTFAAHAGFDFTSMKSAWQHNRHGLKIRGGSTISQQVAKNLYLWPGPSYLRKGIEAYLTVLIEVLWPKQRILEVYLNSAEFGRGVFGVEAASKRYFKKSAAKLTTAQAALLAAVLPAPKRYRADNPSAYVRAKQTWIIRQMAHLGGTAALQSL
ncbi:MAG: monofunctional biosynthetic peptidoglycan transglycosylase [Steroidobacteraceae bacterium]